MAWRKYPLTSFLILFLSLSFITNVIIKIERHFYGVKQGVTLEGLPLDGYLEREVRNLVKVMAIEKDSLPRDATIMPQTGEIYPERVGLKVKVEDTVKKVMMTPKDTPVFLKIKVLLPIVTAADVAEITEQLGSYRTFISGSPDRVHNVTLAARRINYILLKPGEIFSFNRIVGPRTANRGYLPAPIIVNETHELGYGGGVCQVASTLYNAVNKAKLQVIERHRHTKKVSYVPPGKDATVTYPYLDFKFKNNTESSIIIRSGVGGGQINFSIIGKI